MIKHMLASITTPDTPERPSNTDIDLHKVKQRLFAQVGFKKLKSSWAPYVVLLLLLAQNVKISILAY